MPTIGELPPLPPSVATSRGHKWPIDDMVLPAEGPNAITHALKLSNIVDFVKVELGFLKKPLTKCQHCGQWGAVYCACIKCGAPIDPAE